MPNININVVDNTTVSYSGSEIVVFVPNEDTLNIEALKDTNGCVLLKDSNDIGGFFPKDQSTEAKNAIEANKTFQYAKAIVDSGLQVLIGPAINDSFPSAILSDKNEYNIKFLTSGTKPTISLVETASTKSKSTATEEESAQEPVLRTGLEKFKKLLDIAATRRDCTVVADIDAGKMTLDAVYTEINKDATFATFVLENLRWAGLYYTKGAYTNGAGDISKLGDLAFLQGYAKQYLIGKQWESIAGVARGTVSIADDAVVSKYVVDNTVQKVTDSSKIAFNAICNVRPYGATIWGDRTLYKSAKLKASSFFSIMNMVTDISKRCYAASIENTFESNSDITWTNYKARISSLLDEMVGAYKLAAYAIKRVPAEQRATIACKIHIIPIEPVEDFDITVILENADATIEMN